MDGDGVVLSPPVTGCSSLARHATLHGVTFYDAQIPGQWPELFGGGMVAATVRAIFHWPCSFHDIVKFERDSLKHAMDGYNLLLKELLTCLEYLLVAYNIYSNEYITHTWYMFCRLIKYNKKCITKPYHFIPHLVNPIHN